MTSLHDFRNCHTAFIFGLRDFRFHGALRHHWAWQETWIPELGGGFKYSLFSSNPLPGEMIKFDYNIFQMGWNQQPVFFVVVWPAISTGSQELLDAVNGCGAGCIMAFFWSKWGLLFWGKQFMSDFYLAAELQRVHFCRLMYSHFRFSTTIYASRMICLPQFLHMEFQSEISFVFSDLISSL